MAVEIQDSKRENELINLFNLTKTNYNRIGVDAKLKTRHKLFEFEIKSTTTGVISSASPLTLEHVKKWRTRHWIFGIYNKQAELQYCYYGSPDKMTAWLDYWENDIGRGIKISDMLVDRIDYDMLFNIFGEKTVYTLQDAKPVFKALYTSKEYKELQDRKNGYSAQRMLKMFKDHNQTYLYRGSGVNNPKIRKSVYQNWIKITSNYSATLRKILHCQNKPV
jgi:hypothetical protein